MIHYKKGLKMKNRLHRYEINRPRPKHGYICTRYIMCFSVMMIICIKQHQSKTWSSIHKIVKQREAELKKSVYGKSVFG